MSDGDFPIDRSINVQKLWEKYEEIAMHFNDLLMRLRSQSLAGVAAVSTLIGIFAKEGVGGIKLDWLIANHLFQALALFWLALASLDLLYYNRLLMGAVAALTALEKQAKPGTEFTAGINMSTEIENEFNHSFLTRWPARFQGVFLFYLIVLGVILGGAFYAKRLAV